MNKIFLSCCFFALFPFFLADTILAADTLTGSEIQRLLSGKTVTGTAGKTRKFVKSYSVDGIFSLEVDGKKRAGTWRVTGNKYCQTQSEQEQCYATVKQSNGSFQMLEDSGKVHTTFTIK